MSEIYVTSNDSLADAVRAARPGDTIILCQGEGEVTQTKEGITIRREKVGHSWLDLETK